METYVNMARWILFPLTEYVRLVCFDGKGWERIHYMILKPENPFSYEWMVVMQ